MIQFFIEGFCIRNCDSIDGYIRILDGDRQCSDPHMECSDLHHVFVCLFLQNSTRTLQAIFRWALYYGNNTGYPAPIFISKGTHAFNVS